MNKKLDELFKKNSEWAKKIKQKNSDFFTESSKNQHPELLWIGCSDSRVPASQMIEQDPGNVFVHRNIANLVLQSDMNCQSVIQYAVSVLKVKHVIVCGHYGCGGIKAALSNKKMGLIDNWLRNVKDLYELHQEEIDALPSEEKKTNFLAELNVQAQVSNVCNSPFVQKEWSINRELWVHGWIYNLETGLIKDLEISVGHDAAVES